MRYRILLLLLMATCLHFNLWALTRSEANDIVVNQVINPSPYSATLVAYSYDPPGSADFLTSGDVVGEFESPDLKTISEDTWFFWIDYFPSTWFVHPTALVFVSDATGEVEVIDTEWFPVINDQYIYGDYNTRITSPDIFYGNPSPIVDDGPNPVGLTQADEGQWAVLAAGPADHPASNADLDAMEGALTAGAPGPGVPEGNVTKTKGSKDDLCTALENLGEQDPPCEKLFFHWTGHGNTTTLYWGDPPDPNMKMTYQELSEKLNGTNAEDFCISIEACRSGGGLPTLRDNVGGAGVTSTDSETNAGFTDDGSHFTQAFAACLQSNDADRDEDGMVSYAEAHAWAKTQSAEANGQNPQLWGLPEIVPTLSEWGVILFALLLLAFGIVFIRRQETQLALANQAGTSRQDAAPWLIPVTGFPKALLATVPMVTFLIFIFYGEVTTLDIFGILLSSAILAYLWCYLRMGQTKLSQ